VIEDQIGNIYSTHGTKKTRRISSDAVKTTIISIKIQAPQTPDARRLKSTLQHLTLFKPTEITIILLYFNPYFK
jgi:hypothetical protein